MKTLALTCLTIVGLFFVSSCETNNYEDVNRGTTTTTTTEETTLRTPVSTMPGVSTTETHTTRSY